MESVVSDHVRDNGTAGGASRTREVPRESRHEKHMLFPMVDDNENFVCHGQTVEQHSREVLNVTHGVT